MGSWGLRAVVAWVSQPHNPLTKGQLDLVVRKAPLPAAATAAAARRAGTPVQGSMAVG